MADDAKQNAYKVATAIIRELRPVLALYRTHATVVRVTAGISICLMIGGATYLFAQPEWPAVEARIVESKFVRQYHHRPTARPDLTVSPSTRRLRQRIANPSNTRRLAKVYDITCAYEVEGKAFTYRYRDEDAVIITVGNPVMIYHHPARPSLVSRQEPERSVGLAIKGMLIAVAIAAVVVTLEVACRDERQPPSNGRSN